MLLLRTALLVSKGAVADNIKNLDFVPDIYSPYYIRVTPKIVKDSHELNMKIVVWAINTLEEIEEFRSRWNYSRLPKFVQTDKLIFS